MAQTSDGMTFKDAIVLVSSDGTTYKDISGFGASVAVDEGERATPEQHTFEGDTPIVLAGKRAQTKVTVRYVYTDATSDAFDEIEDMYATEGGEIHLKYSPKGGQWFTASPAIIKKPGYPGGDAKADAVVMCEFVIACSELTRSAASS